MADGTHHVFSFSLGHVSPPCSVFRDDWNLPEADNPKFSTLKVTAEYVEFYTVQGKRVTASW